jgi:hypothetical protein
VFGFNTSHWLFDTVWTKSLGIAGFDEDQTHNQVLSLGLQEVLLTHSEVSSRRRCGRVVIQQTMYSKMRCAQPSRKWPQQCWSTWAEDPGGLFGYAETT